MLFSAYVRDGYKCVAKGKCLDAINDGLNTNERTSNIKTKFYKPNDAYCSQNESEMCCRTTLINETATDKDCFEIEDYECLLPNECDTGKETIKEFRKTIFYSEKQMNLLLTAKKVQVQAKIDCFLTFCLVHVIWTEIEC